MADNSSDNFNMRGITHTGKLLFFLVSKLKQVRSTAALVSRGQECSLLCGVCVRVQIVLLQSDGGNIHIEASNVPTWLGTRVSRVMAFF